MSDRKPLNDIQVRYLCDLAGQVDRLGQQITEKAKLMGELLIGRRVRSRGMYFEVQHVRPERSGSGGTNVILSGPSITKTGHLHARNRGAAAFTQIEEIDT